jgi:hypothetical protein
MEVVRRIRVFPMVTALLLSGVVAVVVSPRAGEGDAGVVAEQHGAASRTCTIRLIHRGQPLPGVHVSVLAEHSVPEMPRMQGAPTTDSTGRMTVRVDVGRTFTPYLDRSGEGIGWALLVLASIDGEKRPDFCRHEEVIELPDTLVRVRVTEALDGKPVSGAGVGLDNVGVRLGGEKPPDRGVVMNKANTGEEGVVEIPGVAPGLWRISAGTEQASKHAETTIRVGEGDSVVVDLALVFRGHRTLPYDQYPERDPGDGSLP